MKKDSNAKKVHLPKTGPAGIVCAHAMISGRVQGIFYRASAQSEAVKRSLAGWVKNTPDGKVELIAQGPRSEVEDFLDWCRSGPMLADVSKVEVVWEEPNNDLNGFEIKEYLCGIASAARNIIAGLMGLR